jgi:predicted enzyme related to lactoylglutathione lyase
MTTAATTAPPTCEATISHLGICVSDLERSATFYTEVLGFEPQSSATIGAPFDVLTGLPGLRCKIAFFLKQGLRIELLQMEQPVPTGDGSLRPMNALGLTHITVVVDDLDTMAERIEKAGGSIHPETRVQSAAGQLMFGADPDGVRLELWVRP